MGCGTPPYRYSVVSCPAPHVKGGAGHETRGKAGACFPGEKAGLVGARFFANTEKWGCNYYESCEKLTSKIVKYMRICHHWDYITSLILRHCNVLIFVSARAIEVEGAGTRY